MRTNYGLLKTILLSLITFGIYAIVVYSRMSEDVNTVCRKDGKHTMHYALMFFLIAPLTLGIGSIVWTHRMCNRMRDQIEKDNIDYSFGAGTFWGWGVLGSLIIIGPLVFEHKRFKAMNLLNERYNEKEDRRDEREREEYVERAKKKEIVEDDFVEDEIPDEIMDE